LSFRVSFCCQDCEEDDRGDLPFVAGYGARRSRLSPSLAKERGTGSFLDTTHSPALFSPFLFLLPQTLAAAIGLPIGLVCRPTPSGHENVVLLLSTTSEAPKPYPGAEMDEADLTVMRGLLDATSMASSTSPRGCGSSLGRARGQALRALQGKRRCAQHRGDLLCPDHDEFLARSTLMRR
jgi:hypothetical protein